MCGIAGIYSFERGRQAAAAELNRMIQMLHHRGPDGHGFHVDGAIGLAHARLSIIDLEGGQQPIHNEDRSVWAIFNGEIYNFIELRADLERAGHRFYTHSDTEVIVHLYEDYGEQFVQHLNGQFAIALWDNRAQKLVLVRDRPGIHPLYYCSDGGRLLFASEVKAILPALRGAPSLDPVGLDQIMTFWAPVGATTIFKDVRLVLPGEMLVAQNGVIKTRKYWDWTFPADDQYRTEPESQQAEQLHALLLDATRIRLRADVPVGAYLSGGLDSSVITALMHDLGAALRTFSLGFEREGLDESDYQKLMVEHLGTDHSRIQCKNDDIANAFKDAIWHTEMPILRTAPVPMMLLSRLVREQGYKVVLTGEGSDEVLGGYDIFKEAKIRRFWAANRQSKFRPLLLKRLYPYLEISPGRMQSFTEAFFGVGLDHPDVPYFSHLPRWTTTANCKTFYSEALKAQLNSDPIDVLSKSLPDDIGRWHPFNRGQYVEAKTLLAGYLLSAQGDRMLMASSVEGRFPYLDHRVIEFAGTLRPSLKMKVLNEKYLLKQAMRRYLPAQILERHKQPYRAPDIDAFYSGTTPEYVDDLMSEATIKRYGYFDPQKAALLVRKIRQGRSIGFKDNMAFVGMLSVQVWHQHFIENFHRHSQTAPQ